MAIIVQMKSSVRWLTVDTCTESLVPFSDMFIPRKGRVLSVAVSMVKLKEECLEFRTPRKEVAALGPGMIANASSTYRL